MKLWDSLVIRFHILFGNFFPAVTLLLDLIKAFSAPMMLSISALLSVANAREIRSLEQSHRNATGIRSVNSKSRSPNISCKISSGRIVTP